ncbi:MAG: trans-sulfuration enzyme family protein [Candidatus Natronoplasma sp.]
MKKGGFSTRCIHEAEDPEETKDGDVVTPIHPSSTFAKKSIDRLEEGYSYSRTSNPTRYRLERKLASLENGDFGLAFASGLAAETAVLSSLLEEGDHIVAFEQLYGGTKRLFDEVMKDFGLDTDYVDATDPKKVEEKVTEETKIIWLESPTNPLMKIADIGEISEIAHNVGAKVVVDNTFATPYFQRPLELGADVVVHSLTKYLGGHSDLIGGGVITRDEELHEKIKFHQKAAGAILSPFDSWLAIRGIKSLKPRMELHFRNAYKTAEYLEEHEKVEDVYYPGLRSHPQHVLAKAQMDGYGGMLSFEVQGGLKEAKKFVEELDLFTLAGSLGGVESLVQIPSLMTHSHLSEEEREKVGIKDNLVRLSVGIEEVEDLLNDLERALEEM